MSNRFHRLEALFDAALAVPLAQRRDWCAEHCGGDASLEAELLALLANDERLASARTANPLTIGERALDAAIDREAHAGSRVGHYHLREEIGRGGMGRVLRAVRYEDGVEREVAIKFVRRELLDDTTRRRFRQELRALATLDHPAIARLLEGGETDDGTPYVVMEMVHGERLLAHCASCKLDLRARLALFRQVVAAVAHAHRKLVVHRDIKPGNVLVDRHGQAKLLDFGIAKPLDAEPGETATVDRYLTPAYAAPEQWRGGASGVSCDVYALGALLYELLTGGPPFRFEGLSAVEVERLVLATPPAALDRASESTEALARTLGAANPAAWRKHLRGDLDAIVQKSLRKEPEQRYLSVEQLDDDLVRYLEGRPVAAARSSAGYRARKFLLRHRVAVGVAAVLTATLTTGIVAVVHSANVASAERDRAQSALAIMRDAFKSADPMRLAGPTLGAREILDAAARRIENLDVTQPLLYCELSAEITDVQLALGIYSRDDSLVQRALERGIAVGAPPPLLRRLRTMDAKRRLALRDLAGADAVLRQLEAEQDDDAAVLSQRAYYWLLHKQPELGVPLALRAAELGRVLGDGHPREQATMQLAELFRLSRRYDDALRTLDELLEEQVAEVGASHARALITRLRRIPVLTALKKHANAIEDATALVAEIPDRFGEASAIVAHASALLAQAYLAAGDPTSAAPHFESATHGFARNLGALHVNTVKSRYNLADALARSGAQLARIDAEFERAIAEALAGQGPDDPLVWYFRAKHAAILLARGDRERAAVTLLPEGSDPDLDRLGDEENRTAYLDLLESAFDLAQCADANGGPDERLRRAARLVCGQHAQPN